MSKKVNNRQSVRPDGARLAPKAQRREAARLAKRRRIAASRRRRVAIRGAVGLLAVAAVVAFAAACGAFTGSSDAPTSPASTATPGSGASPAPASTALATKPVVTAGTGDLSKLVTTTVVPGTGPALRAGQQVTVNYVGAFYKTGKEFDSSWSRSEPFTFALGQGNVIAGWDQGLVGVNVGSRVQLDIPAELAYGDSGAGGRPAGPLRFVVDVISAT